MASDKVTPPSLIRKPDTADASTGSGQMNLSSYGGFGDSPQPRSAAAANTEAPSDMQAVQASMTETLRQTAEQMQKDKERMLEELSRQHAETLRKEQEDLHHQMMKQQQAYEERQSALFAQMAAQEENFRRQKEEMMEQMKMQQELYLQQQAQFQQQQLALQQDFEKKLHIVSSPSRPTLSSHTPVPPPRQSVTSTPLKTVPPSTSQFQVPTSWLPSKSNVIVSRETPKTEKFRGSAGENWEAFIEKWERSMIALQLDETQKAQFLVEALDGGAYQVYKNVVRGDKSLSQNYTRLKIKLSEEFSTTAKQVWLIRMGRKSVLEYYGEFMEAVDHSYSDGKRDEQLLAGLFISHMKPSLKDALEKKNVKTLEGARKEAARLEALEHRKTNEDKVSAVNDDGNEDMVMNVKDSLTSLNREMSHLRDLVQNQTKSQNGGNNGRNQNGQNFRGRGRGRGRQNNRYGNGRFYNNGGYGNQNNYNDYGNYNGNYNGYNNNRGNNHNNGANNYPDYNHNSGNGNRSNDARMDTQKLPAPPQLQRDQCAYCKKFGHIKKNCPDLRKVNAVDHMEDDDFADFVLSVTNQDNQDDSNPTVNQVNQVRSKQRSKRTARVNQVYCITNQDNQDDSNPTVNQVNQVRSQRKGKTAACVNQVLSATTNQENQDDSNPTVNQVNQVRSQQRGTNATHVNKMSTIQMVTLAALTFCCLIDIGSTATNGTKSGLNPRNATGPIYAERPLVCSSAELALPHIHPLSYNYKCDTQPRLNSTNQPLPVTATVYSENSVEWKVKAWQCFKTLVTVSTQVSFWTDVKDKRVARDALPVTASECRSMVNTKTCSEGSLYGNDGVYTTDNKVDISYVYCCKWNDFPVKQCSFIRASVFKRYGDSEFTSSAGDVSHCSYESGECTLDDSSMLIWDVKKNDLCKYERWFAVEGKYLDNHFISTAEDLALTFFDNGLTPKESCTKKPVIISDQGLVVSFNDSLLNAGNLTDLATEKLAKAVKFADDSGVVANGPKWTVIIDVIKAFMQSMAYNIAEVESTSYWSSYKYACNNIAQVLRTMSVLAEHHPTSVARHILGTSNLRAESGQGFLQVYPCTEVETYQLLPMEEDNCTIFLPINITIGGSTHLGYLDPTDNIVHTQSAQISCSSRPKVALRLEGEIVWYDHNGTLTNVSLLEDLRIPGLSLGAHPIRIHETVYNQAHRLDWHRFSSHSDLNEVLATLSRQRRVLEAMGIQSGPHHTFEKNVIESKENLLGNAFFSFLFGGHVASGFELWTLGANIAVTLMALGMIANCVRNQCLSRRAAMIAAVNVDDCEDPDEDVEASLTQKDSSDQTSFKDYPIMDDLAESYLFQPLVPSAPSTVSTIPPYNPIYPSLPSSSQ